MKFAASSTLVASLLLLLLLVECYSTSAATAFVVPARHQLPTKGGHKRQAFCARNWSSLQAKKLKNKNVSPAAAPPKSSAQPSKPTSKIVTGLKGKPAASREEDLKLTLQVIRDFHGLDTDDTIDSGDETMQVQEEKVEKLSSTSGDSLIKNIFADTPDTSSRSLLDDIAQTLAQPCYTAPLARIASAFAPAAGHALVKRQIQHTEIIKLSATSITIAALICEGGDCVTVAIPVDFPTPVVDFPSPVDNSHAAVPKLKESILENIDQLDTMAIAGLEQSERAADNYEEVQSDKHILLELQDESITAIFPDWWTEPMGDWPMQEECSNVKKLLNDDEFQADIDLLAQQQVSRLVANGDSNTKIEEGMTVTHAAVAFVGTSGALVRANLQGRDDDGDSVQRIVDLPISFSTGKATTVQGLRLAVLSLVDE